MLLVYALKVLLYKDSRLSIPRFHTDFVALDAPCRPWPSGTITRRLPKQRLDRDSPGRRISENDSAAPEPNCTAARTAPVSGTGQLLGD